MKKNVFLWFVLSVVFLVACGGNEEPADVAVIPLEPEPLSEAPSAVELDPASEVTQSDEPFVISAVPDQPSAVLDEKYELLVSYLSGALDVPVVYQPVSDHATAVAEFTAGNLDMVWFDGLHGTKARLAVDRSQAILHRPSDASTEIVFVALAESGIEAVADAENLSSFAGRALAFGADSLQLVEAGTEELALLDAAVWDAEVASGAVDEEQVVAVFRTAEHHSKHWLLNPNVVTRYGAHFPQKITEAMVTLDPNDPSQATLLELFRTDQFVYTDNDNYTDVEMLGRMIGFISEQ